MKKQNNCLQLLPKYQLLLQVAKTKGTFQPSGTTGFLLPVTAGMYLYKMLCAFQKSMYIMLLGCLGEKKKKNYSLLK